MRGDKLLRPLLAARVVPGVLRKENRPGIALQPDLVIIMMAAISS